MICVSPVVDVEDDDLVLDLVDLIPHPVLSAECAPESSERHPQWSSDDTWSLREWPGDEFPRRKCGSLGERIGQCPTGPGPDHDAVRRLLLWVTRHDARADVAAS